jgi:calcineurin-like phosphoesterase family protein
VRPLGRVASSASVLTAVVLTVGLLSVPTASSLVDPARGTLADESARAVARRAAVEVVAVGDIACAPARERTRATCHEGRTARLTAAIDPDAVLALGDLQYRRGSHYAFRHSYDQTWGALLGRTYPIPGNHEYLTPDARGYYRYFDARQPGPPGYYAFNLRRWRVYALNTNCTEISCARERRWLRRDLAARPRRCSLFAMHHPPFSSQPQHRSDADLTRFFRIARRQKVEMILAGHHHHYERFRRMGAGGEPRDIGVMSFISGAGGRSLQEVGQRHDGSAYRLPGHFGVLRLGLRPDGFTFAFRDVDGTARDTGSRACR